MEMNIFYYNDSTTHMMENKFYVKEKINIHCIQMGSIILYHVCDYCKAIVRKASVLFINGRIGHEGQQ